MKDFILSNGSKIPSICFGTGITYLKDVGINGKIQKMKCLAKALLNVDRKRSILNLTLPGIIECAMENGCNCFDCSRAYGASEYTLGTTLRKYNRDSYYIITKLSNSDQYRGHVREGLESSLKEMGLDYIDLYLMHWPVKDYFINSWLQMEKLYLEGKCKAIGVCNCNIHHLEEIKKYATIMPMVNEIECHPLFTQTELREYCKNHGIQIIAYTSTARMDERLWKTCLVDIAKKYHKNMAQIILRWHYQIGNIPIFNSTSKEHIKDNLNINDFELSKDEIVKICKININSRLRYDPDNCAFDKL